MQVINSYTSYKLLKCSHGYDISTGGKLVWIYFRYQCSIFELPIGSEGKDVITIVKSNVWDNTRCNDILEGVIQVHERHGLSKKWYML